MRILRPGEAASNGPGQVLHPPGDFRHQPEASPFRSFWQGGFEGSTLRTFEGRRLDVIAATRHDMRAAEDYALLHGAGVRSVRDALRWHVIEEQPGRYDWSSWLPMLRAARTAGVQVTWDLSHYGVPDWMDIWSADFPDRFAEFAAAAARLLRLECDDVPVWCPVNEISFWAWCGGDCAGLYPSASGRGWELKRQLVRATILASCAVLDVDSRARLLQAEPLIHIAARMDADEQAAADYTEAQFEACDMIAGRMDPELGGEKRLLDIVGLNFYFDNQWAHNGWTLGLGHPDYRPLGRLLADVHARYGRPMLIAETGAEGVNGPAWLRSVAGEVRSALRAGLPVLGICLYPVMDYPGWEDDRHCPCGLIRVDADWEARSLDRALLAQLREEQMLLAAAEANAQARDAAD